MDAKDLIIDADASLVAALEQLDKTAKKCLFVVDGSEKLIGSLSDGDIRRLILRCGTLQGTVEEAMNSHPVSITEDERAHAIALMHEQKINALPILDSKGCIRDVVFVDDETIARQKLPEKIPVVMMAGGVGSRLLPLTAVLPKPLIPINGTTIAERIIGRFHDSGCDDFYLILNYKKAMIKAYFDEINRDYNVIYIDEKEFLGTGGGLKLLAPYLDSTFILTNCDILVDASVNELLEVHRKSGNAVTCVCSLKNFQIPYGTIEISSGGEIEQMKEKPTINSLINTGCYMVEPEVLDFIGDNEKIGFPDVMTRCKEAGLKVGVFPISEGAWLDMGQFDEMKRMNSVLSDAEVEK